MLPQRRREVTIFTAIVRINSGYVGLGLSYSYSLNLSLGRISGGNVAGKLSPSLEACLLAGRWANGRACGMKRLWRYISADRKELKRILLNNLKLIFVG